MEYSTRDPAKTYTLDEILDERGPGYLNTLLRGYGVLAGYVIVPREPTDGMLMAAAAVGDVGLRTKYQAMLAAAPIPPPLALLGRGRPR